VWTRKCVTWWPTSHTLSGDPSAITFEPLAGGRIVETGPDGAEHLWGEVLDWEPPGRLRFRWHLFFDRSEATEVEITFSPRGDGTVVRLEQTGWDNLGRPAAHAATEQGRRGRRSPPATSPPCRTVGVTHDHLFSPCVPCIRASKQFGSG
jgi:uncharacterized protein YndB with AHSA1/START domain